MIAVLHPALALIASTAFLALKGTHSWMHPPAGTRWAASPQAVSSYLRWRAVEAGVLPTAHPQEHLPTHTNSPPSPPTTPPNNTSRKPPNPQAHKRASKHHHQLFTLSNSRLATSQAQADTVHSIQCLQASLCLQRASCHNGCQVERCSCSCCCCWCGCCEWPSPAGEACTRSHTTLSLAAASPCHAHVTALFTTLLA
jgi:hypothetical protein